jgi:hypothetical protein
MEKKSQVAYISYSMKRYVTKNLIIAYIYTGKKTTY